MAERGASGSRSGQHIRQELPSDAVAVRNVLKSMGVEQHDPRVVNMLLDFMYKYVSEVVLDAEAFSEQAGRPGEVDTEDITLAIQSRTAHYFIQHPPIASQQQLGDRVNAVPLPEFRSDLHGLRYPPEPYNLINPNWQIQVTEAAQYDGRSTPMDTQ